MATGANRIRLALAVMRAPDAPSFSAVASDSDAPDSLINLLHDRRFSAPQDRASIIVAAHTLCNHRVFQAKFLAADGLSALCELLNGAASSDDVRQQQQSERDNNNENDDDNVLNNNNNKNNKNETAEPCLKVAVGGVEGSEHSEVTNVSNNNNNKTNSLTNQRREPVNDILDQSIINPSSDSDSTTLSVTPAAENELPVPTSGEHTPPVRNSSSSSSSSSHHVGARPLSQLATAPGGIHRTVWNAAIRTIAKLMVVSTAACSRAIDTGSLFLLAKAAKPGEPMDIRLRAAAGLAAIAAWSGPRRAMDIVQTTDVVLSMTSLLTEQDERIPNDLRTATIDGLVVMSFRRHARGVLQKYGCDEKIKAAARFATVSGDYTSAARSTVAAGHLTGRSIDEYGFMVEEKDKATAAETPHDGAESAPETLGDAADANHVMMSESPTRLVRRATGLEQIHQKLLEEPYIEVEDLNVLEEIVHEDAGVLSSSPRDRNYVRRAARTYGVSADEIEFISLLEEGSSPSKQQHDDGSTSSEQRARLQLPCSAVGSSSMSGVPTVVDNDEIEPGRLISSLQGSADGRDLTTPPRRRASSRVQQRENRIEASPNRTSGSSPRTSSHLFAIQQDPDFDRGLTPDGDEDQDVASNATTGVSSKTKIVSPLLMFSSAARKAAERDQARHKPMKKTDSQLGRDSEHERKWKSVLDKHHDLLNRERGKTSRVVGYRQLAPIPVPPNLRRRLWPLLLDTAALREYKPNLYGKLCREAGKRQLSDDIEHTIEADVTRTMPLHSLFWAGGAQVGVQSLRSILRAYAFYVPDVGYCQGMSSIAAVMLMNAADEEEAFLMMVQFMNRFQYKKVFAHGFPLMMHWLSELKPLVAHYMPALCAHMERESVALELYADKWLITALSHNFPHRHLLRIWDLMFLGGSPKIVLKACLMVLKCCENRLMEMDFEGMISLLQREFADPEVGVLDLKNPEPFISQMREFRFMSDIKKAAVASSDAVASGSGGGVKTGAAGTGTGTGKGTGVGNQMRQRRNACLECFGCFGSGTKED